MGIRVEWGLARNISGQLVGSGYCVDGESAVDAGHVGLLIDCGQGSVVEGTRDELRALLARLSAVVEGEATPASESPYYDGDDESDDEYGEG